MLKESTTPDPVELTRVRAKIVRSVPHADIYQARAAAERLAEERM